MAERYALVYARAGALRCLDAISLFLEGQGVSIHHPTTGCVFRLDEEGEQVATDLASLRRFIEEHNDVSFQWWLAPDHDVYCRLRGVGTMTVLEFGMEGCGPAELGRIRGVLLEHFRAEGVAGVAIGLVFDPEGAAEDYDWDVFFVEGDTVDFGSGSIGIPALLALEKEQFGRVDGLPAKAAVMNENDFVLISTQ